MKWDPEDDPVGPKGVMRCHRIDILINVRFEVFTAVTMKNGVFILINVCCTRRFSYS
jgi:hypothetical protein